MKYVFSIPNLFYALLLPASAIATGLSVPPKKGAPAAASAQHRGGKQALDAVPEDEGDEDEDEDEEEDEEDAEEDDADEDQADSSSDSDDDGAAKESDGDDDEEEEDDDDEQSESESDDEDDRAYRFGGGGRGGRGSGSGRVDRRTQEQIEADAELDRELQMLTTMAIDARKLEERRPAMQLAEAGSLAGLTVMAGSDKKAGSATAAVSAGAGKEAAKSSIDHDDDDDDEEDEDAKAPAGVAFRLVTRRGNRPQARTLMVPATSEMALRVAADEEARAREREEIKSFVVRGVHRAAVADFEEDERQRRAILRYAVSVRTSFR